MSARQRLNKRQAGRHTVQHKFWRTPGLAMYYWLMPVLCLTLKYDAIYSIHVPLFPPWFQHVFDRHIHTNKQHHKTKLVKWIKLFTYIKCAFPDVRSPSALFLSKFCAASHISKIFHQYPRKIRIIITSWLTRSVWQLQPKAVETVKPHVSYEFIWIRRTCACCLAVGLGLRLDLVSSW